MPARKVVHVVPDKKEGGWNVEVERHRAEKEHFGKKTEAVGVATHIAKEAPLGQVKIHKRDGTIETEHTYGKDPKR